MAKPIKIIADLSIQNRAGEIKVTNDENGSLLIDFPNKNSINTITDIPLPFPIRSGVQAIAKTNAALLEQRQPVIVRVDHEEWLVLGRDEKPLVKYLKLAPVYLKRYPNIKIALYMIGGGIGALLTYLIVKKRN